MDVNIPRVETILFGAANGIQSGCTDEYAVNFDLYANTDLDCSFGTLGGCMHHDATNYNDQAIHDEYEDEEATTVEHQGTCHFASPEHEILRINWFFDENAVHYPGICRADAPWEFLWVGNADNLVSGSIDANEPAAFRLSVPAGEYFLWPLSQSLQSTGGYQGSFSVHSEQSGEKLPFIQFTPSIIEDMSLVSFQVGSTSDNAADWQAGDVASTYLNLDNSSCRSWHFGAGDELTYQGAQGLDNQDISSLNNFDRTDYSIEFWFQAESVQGTIPILTVNNFQLGIKNQFFSVWNSQDEMAAKHAVLDGEEDDVSKIQPWLWYHVLFRFDDNGQLSLDVSPIYADNSDGDLWNDSFVNSQSSSGWSENAVSDFSIAFGSDAFDGLIHRFSIFDEVITDSDLQKLFLGLQGESWTNLDLTYAPTFVATAGSDDRVSNAMRALTSLGVTDEFAANGPKPVYKAPRNRCQSGCNRRYADGRDL